MILGVGNDIIDIRRIEKVIDRYDQKFIKRIFTDIEIEKSERRRNKAASYAKRFAAKEACSKALGTGIAQGVTWRDLGVINLPGGRPSFVLTGRAHEHMQAMTPDGFEPIIHLTITDDFPMAQAFVIISAIMQQ